MNKKILAMSLITCFLLTALTGCGGSASSTAPAASSAAPAASSAAPAASSAAPAEKAKT